jgi:hypothetical protein
MGRRARGSRKIPRYVLLRSRARWPWISRKQHFRTDGLLLVLEQCALVSEVSQHISDYAKSFAAYRTRRINLATSAGSVESSG